MEGFGVRQQEQGVAGGCLRACGGMGSGKGEMAVGGVRGPRRSLTEKVEVMLAAMDQRWCCQSDGGGRGLRRHSG